MRRTVFTCDKCGKEITLQDAEIYEVYRHDFCEDCAANLKEVIKSWIENTEQKGCTNTGCFKTDNKAITSREQTNAGGQK